MKKIFLILILSGLFIGKQSFSQISSAVLGGISIPQGETFSYNGKGGGIGLSYSLSVLYHLPSLEKKLGLGLTLNETWAMGGNATGQSVNVGFYSLDLYGIKGEYRFFKGKISPYGSLSLGLSRFYIGGIAAELTNNDPGIGGNIDAVKSFSFGMYPEIGLDLNYFRMAVGYFVPMKYKAIYGNPKSAGVLEFLLGFRIGFGMKDKQPDNYHL